MPQWPPEPAHDVLRIHPALHPSTKVPCKHLQQLDPETRVLHNILPGPGRDMHHRESDTDFRLGAAAGPNPRMGSFAQ